MNTMQQVEKFDELIKDPKRRVYVLNKTDPPAVVSLTLTNNRTGDKRFGSIPPTWVPIDLTALFTRDILQDSMDVRQYILKGILKLIPGKKAEEILLQPGAKEELQRIVSSKFSGKNVNKAMAELRAANKDMKRLERDAELEDADDSDESGVNDKVRALCVQLEEDTKTSSEVLTSLKSMQHTLTEGDLQYVLNTVDSKKIKEWVKEKLAEVASSGKAHKNGSKKNSRVEASGKNRAASRSNDSSDEEDDDFEE